MIWGTTLSVPHNKLVIAFLFGILPLSLENTEILIVIFSAETVNPDDLICQPSFEHTGKSSNYRAR